MDKIQKVLDTMKNAGKPLLEDEISEISGLSKKEVDKAMKSLMVERRVVSPKKDFWELK